MSSGKPTPVRRSVVFISRCVFAVTHAVITPPYEPPVTPMRVESTSGRWATMSTAFINSLVTNSELMLLGTIEDPNYVFPGSVNGS